MSSKVSPLKPTSKQLDIRALGRFITPVHVSIQRTPTEISLYEVNDIRQKEDFIKLASNGLNNNGKDAFQSGLYESLLKAELAMQKPSSMAISDSEHFNHLISALKSSGLFTMAKSVELLLSKTKLVKSVSNVIISKKARRARKAKGEKTTEEMRKELEDYKASLKDWAIGKYNKDCESRLQRYEDNRPKRSGELAAHIWLLGMVEDDLDLDQIDTSLLNDALVEGLTVEGNYHGSPEQPVHLLGFKLTSTFFYQCIKEEK